MGGTAHLDSLDLSVVRTIYGLRRSLLGLASHDCPGWLFWEFRRREECRALLPFLRSRVNRSVKRAGGLGRVRCFLLLVVRRGSCLASLGFIV